MDSDERSCSPASTRPGRAFGSTQHQHDVLLPVGPWAVARAASIPPHPGERGCDPRGVTQDTRLASSSNEKMRRMPEPSPRCREQAL